jgi:hypothetical protein
MVGAMGRQGKRLSVNLSSTITPSGSLSKGISHNMASTLSAAGSLSTNLILSLVRALFQARPRAFWFVPSTTYVFDVPPGAGMTAIQTDQGDVVIRTLEKNIGFRLNLGNWLDAGETVSTASATVSAVLQSDPTVDMSANAAAMLQSVVINNPVVTVRLGNQNAVLNAVYTVTISITTSMGRVYQESLPPITCDQ